MIITICFNLNGGYVGHIRRFPFKFSLNFV